MLQAGEQNQPIPPGPEIPPVGESGDSTPIKKQRGGKRPGAGRPPDLLKRMVGRLKPATALELLSTVDVEKVIKEIFTKGSLTLKQRALADLMDRAYGRPAQALSVSGTVLHAHWTPGKYSALTDEEWKEYVRLSAKALAPPTQNALPDGPHNQAGNQEIKAITDVREEPHETAQP